MRPSRYLQLAALLLVLFGLVAFLVTAETTQGLDDAWYELMRDAEVGWLVAIGKGFSLLGSGVVGSTIVVVVAALLLVRRSPWGATTWVSLAVVALLLSNTTKELFDRTRPPGRLVEVVSASFPSGHAMVSGAAMGLGIAIIIGQLWPRHRQTALVSGVVYALLMALSRTYLRVHWLTDVVGGLLFGGAVALVFCGLAVRWQHEQQRREKT